MCWVYINSFKWEPNSLSGVTRIRTHDLLYLIQNLSLSSLVGWLALSQLGHTHNPKKSCINDPAVLVELNSVCYRGLEGSHIYIYINTIPPGPTRGQSKRNIHCKLLCKDSESLGSQSPSCYLCERWIDLSSSVDHRIRRCRFCGIHWWCVQAWLYSPILEAQSRGQWGHWNVASSSVVTDAFRRALASEILSRRSSSNLEQADLIVARQPGLSWARLQVSRG